MRRIGIPTRLFILCATFAGLFFAWLFLLFPHSAEALTLAPARLELRGDPGQTIHEKLVVLNEQDLTLTLYSSTENFEAQGESGTPNFVMATEGLATWVDVQSSITLQPGEETTIPFSITIPESADPGGHFAAIFLSETPPGGVGDVPGSQVAISGKLGMLILLRVNGDIPEGGGIADFQTQEQKKFYNSLPLTFTYRFQNDGGDRLKPIGTITVRSLLGIRVRAFDANPSQGNILPQSIRKFEVPWSTKKERKPDDERPILTQEDVSNLGFFGKVGHQWQNFLVGPYRVKLELAHTLESTGEEVTHSESFWFFAFPWQLLIILTIVIVIALITLKKLIRRYNRWVIAQAKRALEEQMGHKK